ncbi:MAG: hypothetical protein HKN32_09115 [Flavobacteriales bacterium]|nr:hypothetical protein [Flavobacteriales bacterium]
MNYQMWTLRNGALRVEKYTGTFSKKDIMENDQEFFGDPPPPNERLLCISDLSQAKFPDISTADMADLFSAIDENADTTYQMKNAIYAGVSNFADYQTINEYLSEGTKRAMSIIAFTKLKDCCSWLGLTPEETTQVNELLLGNSTK